MLSRLSTYARSLAPTVSSNFSLALRPLATTAPSIYDYLIRFHIIDRSGKRHTLQGLAGCSLAQAIYESGRFTEFDDFIFGPDHKEPDAHVYVSNDYKELVRRITHEEIGSIELCAEDIRANSRMASYITLDKTLMDLTVAQGPHQPTVSP
eukprot:jgi/Ulvmu1/714/UM010_0086.1